MRNFWINVLVLFRTGTTASKEFAWKIGDAVKMLPICIRENYRREQVVADFDYRDGAEEVYRYVGLID